MDRTKVVNDRLQLYLGDAQDVLQSLEDDSIDLIVTSPPYADSRVNT